MRTAPRNATITTVGWYFPGLADFEFRLTIVGRPFVLKNSKQVAVRSLRPAKGHHGPRCPRCRTQLAAIPTVLPSKPAGKYLEAAVEQLEALWMPEFKTPIPESIQLNAAIVTYRATAAKNDASNLYELPQDAMQHAGILADDFQIATHDGSRRLLDRKNPRVVITLTPAGLFAGRTKRQQPTGDDQ